MSGTRLYLRLFPHRRAAALLDLRIDALRGEAALSPEDDAFLSAHLARCSACGGALAARQALVAELRTLGGAQAPAGFAGRVLLAARARGREAPVAAPPRGGFAGLFASPSLAAGAVAACLVLGGVGATLHGRVTGPLHDHLRGTVEAGGTAMTRGLEAPHFVVRAPSLGAAKVRALVLATVRAQGGSFEESDSAVLARIPRAALIPVTQSLAAQGAFKMSKVGDGELPVELTVLRIRFELE